MKKMLLTGLATGLFIFVSMGSSQAAIITFDDVVSGATSYQYDGDGDGISDIVFSTVDHLGFNTVGPGPNMLYIQEPGLEGTTALSIDLRVDFINGAANSLGFGFAFTDPNSFASFSVFDSGNNILASATTPGDYTQTPQGFSSFPEGFLSLNFSGLASYGLFDFTGTATRFIIDNFQGTFGSTEDINPVPIPGAVWLLASGVVGIIGIRRKKKA